MKLKKLAALLCALMLCLAGLSAIAENTTTEEGDNDMQMMIGETPVTVAWENNESVEALKALAAEGLTIEMSMYGGFEQVGSIGQSLPRDDAQTTTTSGYTRLGHITDQTPEQMKALLGNGDVTITLSMK